MRGSGIIRNKTKGQFLGDVKCTKNEAYGGVAAGYKVIREVSLSLQEMSYIIIQCSFRVPLAGVMLLLSCTVCMPC